MKPLTGFAALLMAQAAGEVLARWVKESWGGSMPGPVIGMLLLFVALTVPVVKREMAPAIGHASQILLSHLSLLFVPVGVGVVVHLNLLSAYGFKLAVVIVLSTWLGLAVTALVLRARWPAQEP